MRVAQYWNIVPFDKTKAYENTLSITAAILFELIIATTPSDYTKLLALNVKNILYNSFEIHL